MIRKNFLLVFTVIISICLVTVFNVREQREQTVIDSEFEQLDNTDQTVTSEYTYNKSRVEVEDQKLQFYTNYFNAVINPVHVDVKNIDRYSYTKEIQEMKQGLADIEAYVSKFEATPETEADLRNLEAAFHDLIEVQLLHTIDYSLHEGWDTEDGSYIAGQLMSVLSAYKHYSGVEEYVMNTVEHFNEQTMLIASADQSRLVAKNIRDFDSAFVLSGDTELRPKLASMLNAIESNDDLLGYPEYAYEKFEDSLSIETDGKSFVFSQEELLNSVKSDSFHQLIREENAVTEYMLDSSEIYYLFVTNEYYHVPNDIYTTEFEVLYPEAVDYSKYVHYEPNKETARFIDDLGGVELLDLKPTEHIELVVTLLQRYEGLLDPILLGGEGTTIKDGKYVKKYSDLLNQESELLGLDIYIVDDIKRDEDGSDLAGYAYGTSYIVIEDFHNSDYFEGTLHHEIMHIVDSFYAPGLFLDRDSVFTLGNEKYLDNMVLLDEEYFQKMNGGDYNSLFSTKYVQQGVLSGYARTNINEDIAELWSESIMNHSEVVSLRDDNELLNSKLEETIGFINAIYVFNRTEKEIKFDDLRNFR